MRSYSCIAELVLMLLEIERNPAITQAQLAAKLSVSRVTVSRLMDRARRDLNVQIERPAGPDRPYRLLNWGILNRTAAVKFIASTSRKVK